MPPAPSNPLSIELAELDSAWLRIGCSGRWTVIPVSRLAESRGTHTRLVEILPKLRCRRCGQAPDEIELTDDASFGASGRQNGARSWMMDFTGRAGPRDAAVACKRVG